MSPSTPIFAVGLCFTRGDESQKSFNAAFRRSKANAEKIDDLLRILEEHDLYEGGNKAISLEEISNLQQLRDDLEAAGHGKTVAFIDLSREESDCSDWCIYIMQSEAAMNPLEAALFRALPKVTAS